MPHVQRQIHELPKKVFEGGLCISRKDGEGIALQVSGEIVLIYVTRHRNITRVRVIADKEKVLINRAELVEITD